MLGKTEAKNIPIPEAEKGETEECEIEGIETTITDAQTLIH